MTTTSTPPRLATRGRLAEAAAGLTDLHMPTVGVARGSLFALAGEVVDLPGERAAAMAEVRI